ncbi:hypothetical protein Ac2012v2_007761 [Leucoagaricus gongylophorus]
MASHPCRPHITDTCLYSQLGTHRPVSMLLEHIRTADVFGQGTVMFLYDDLNFSGNWAAKNVCNMCGYLCFEAGAVIIMGSSQDLNAIALKALRNSSLVILSTIHVQDFPDVEGDAALNRKTIPIVAPVMSRPLTSIVIACWSIYSAFTWSMGIGCSGVFFSVGLTVAARLYFLRTTSDDKMTYIVYNGWLVVLHLLPANARWGVFGL